MLKGWRMICRKVGSGPLHGWMMTFAWLDDDLLKGWMTLEHGVMLMWTGASYPTLWITSLWIILWDGLMTF